MLQSCSPVLQQLHMGPSVAVSQPICVHPVAHLEDVQFVLFRKDKQQTNINSIEAFTDLYVEIYPRKNFKALDAKLGALMQKVRLMQAHIC